LRYHKQIYLYVNIYIIYNTFSKLFNRLGGESKAFDRDQWQPIAAIVQIQINHWQILKSVDGSPLSVCWWPSVDCRLSTADCYRP